MLQEVMLLREAEKVSLYIDNQIKLVGAEKRDEVLELFDNMHRFFPHWVICVCPMMHPEVQYVSRNCSAEFGYSREFLIRNSSLDKFMALVHEDDQQDVFKCITIVHDYLESIPPEQHNGHRVVMWYRFRHADGHYVHVQDEKAAVSLSGKGAGMLYYILLRDISEEKPYSGVKLELFRQDETLVKVREYRPGLDRNPLTPRENDLVTLIRQGLSTKEIAWQLKISHNTVRNIKSKLFEKYNVSNSIELLNLAFAE
jgi:DNA-binding CsgD family transcriptional regulator